MESNNIYFRWTTIYFTYSVFMPFIITCNSPSQSYFNPLPTPNPPSPNPIPNSSPIPSPVPSSDYSSDNYNDLSSDEIDDQFGIPIERPPSRPMVNFPNDTENEDDYVIGWEWHEVKKSTLDH